ncbi:6-phosphofructokinase [Desulfococcaceae bacterium HSG7]|nr:6-phosphofructokinase [Desulfococcaceae bacterium HSG7]
MTSEENPDFQAFLDRPEVQEAISNINSDLTDRRSYKPSQCEVLTQAFTMLQTQEQYSFDIDPEAEKLLPDIIDKRVQKIVEVSAPEKSFKDMYNKKRKIGIVFSGGPAPGGHNVIAGLYDAAKKANPDSEIWGFLMGPDGIIENEAINLTKDIIDQHRNLGGFGMIKTGRTKINTQQKMDLSKETCKALGLDALVVVGGDDSNTNAAFLAQEMHNDGVQVIGVPKTIDGDVQVKDAKGKILCAMSFGFHTAARAFSESVSNLCTDCSSDVKYWHICKVMGRSASHIALEIALQTHANITLIGEDIADYTDLTQVEQAKKDGTIDFRAYGITLRHLSRVLCDAIISRAAAGKNYGVMVIPEGVLEFVNEIQMLIIKLNTIIALHNRTHDDDFHTVFPTLEDKIEHLRRITRRKAGAAGIWNQQDHDLFSDMPDFFQEGLLTERDSHGNFQFSLVKTEKVLMEMVKDYLKELADTGKYKQGLSKAWFQKMLIRENLNPDQFGPVLFKNYSNDILVLKKAIISKKTYEQALIKAELIEENSIIPASIETVYNKSVPKFKTQTHFYGYDGRGNAPTRFDCIYTYNLGLTVFSLIANGATGLMAAIRNLEKEFSEWEPIGIPIAPLMSLEERKGKLELVLEKTLVDVNSNAFKVVEALREKWLAAQPGPDQYRKPGPIRFDGASEENRPLTLQLNGLESGSE